MNLVPLYSTESKNTNSVNFGGEFNGLVMYVCWFGESYDVRIFTYVLQRKNVIHVTFPNGWIKDDFA